MPKHIEPEASLSVNMVQAGTRITGDMESSNDIRFDGNLEGNLKTNGKLIIGTSGTVNGEIVCKNADIEGKVEGRINVQELLTLKSTAFIKGDILAKRLAIDPGAKFTGSCNMTNDTRTEQAQIPNKKETEQVKK